MKPIDWSELGFPAKLAISIAFVLTKYAWSILTVLEAARRF